MGFLITQIGCEWCTFSTRFQQHQLWTSWGLWWISRGSTLWEYHTTSQAELQIYSYSVVEITAVFFFEMAQPCLSFHAWTEWFHKDSKDFFNFCSRVLSGARLGNICQFNYILFKDTNVHVSSGQCPILDASLLYSMFLYYPASRLLLSYYLALCYIFVISRDVDIALCFIKMSLSWFCLVSCGRYLRIFVSEAVFALQPRRFPMTAALKLDGNHFTIDVVYRTRHDCHVMLVTTFN